MTAATLVRDEAHILGGSEVRVRAWSQPGRDNLATLTVTTDGQHDVYAIAAAAAALLGGTTVLILHVDGDLTEIGPTHDGGWWTDPISLPDLAEELGIPAGEVLPS